MLRGKGICMFASCMLRFLGSGAGFLKTVGLLITACRDGCSGGKAHVCPPWISQRGGKKLAGALGRDAKCSEPTVPRSD